MPRHHHRESIHLSSSPNTISVPLRLRATWSRSVWVTTNWMTAFLWRLQTAEELSGSVTDPALLPSSALRNARLRADEELIGVMTKAVNELGSNGLPLRSHLAAPFFPEVHDELTKSWHAPHSSCIRPSASTALTSVDVTEEKECEHLPPLDESVATHLCPPTAIGWKARAIHPSKPCRATSALAGHAYSGARQAASALHSMAVLLVFQAKMLASEEAGLDAASLRDLRSVTDLALCATKATVQASDIRCPAW